MTLLKLSEDSTDISLFVQTSEEEIEAWNKDKIVDALVREAGCPGDTARLVANEVEAAVLRSGLKKTTVTLVREMVNSKLVELGYTKYSLRHSRFGLPAADVEKITYNKTAENANVIPSPESIHKYFADAVAKQYALEYLISNKYRKPYLADAHLRGDIHIHDLDYFISRPYCIDGNDCVSVEEGDRHLLLPIRTLVENNLQDWHDEGGVEVADIPKKNIHIFAENSYVTLKKVMRRIANEPVYNIRTKSGKSVLLTAEHTVFTDSGETKVKDLRIKDKLVLAAPSYPEIPKIEEIDLVRELKGEAGLYIRGIGKEVRGRAAGKKLVATAREYGIKGIHQALFTDSFPIEVTKYFNYKNAQIGCVSIKETLPARLKITDDLAYLLGYFVGDGCYHIREKLQYTLSITASDAAAIAKIEGILKNLGINANKQKTNSNCAQIYFGNRLWYLVFNKVFGIGRKAKNKTLPKQILQFQPNALVAFLRGLFDSDGSMYANPKVGYQLKIKVTSRALIDQLQFLLSSLGISSYQSIDITKSHHLGGRRLPESRGFALRVTSKDEIERLFGGHFGEPRDGYDEIVKIEKTTPTTPYLYDIEVDEPHGMALNGLLVHNCAGHDLRYIAKYGLYMDGSGEKTAVAKPAKHPSVLILHAAKWLGVNQAYFSGAQAYAMFNTVIAPYLAGLDDQEIYQLAQLFVFEMAQMSVARGAQVVFSDVNIDFGIPKVIANCPATGPSGKVVGVYGDYYEEAMRFAKALLHVYAKGDSRGTPFLFPKPLLKIRKENLGDPEFEDYMLLAHQVSATKGNPYYINQVTYEDESIAMCCRLKHTIRPEDKEDIEEGRMRSNAIQNVTLNLPRLAYLAKGDDAKLVELMRERMLWAKEAHIIKREVMAKLLDSGNAPLLTMNKDGQPYFRLEKARHLIGIVGLNEMVKVHTGQELHESEKATKFGWGFMRRMKEACDEFSRETGYVFAIEQTPAESTAYRFAKLDLKHFNGQAEAAVRGNVATGEVYYTNSTHYNPSAVVPLPEKIKNEGMFHPLIEAGSLSHVWLGESSPDPEALMKFTLKMAENTMNQQIAYTRDLTYCEGCGHLHGGLLERCPDCGGTRLQSWSRITGYLQNIEGWNKGKQAELRDRYRYNNHFNGGVMT